MFGAALTVYLSNAETISSYDTVPNSLLAFNLFEHRTIDFDRFRGSYFDQVGGGYAFVEAPNGHLASDYPIGTALIAFPVYAGLYLIERPPEIRSATFEAERLRDEKFAAASIAALSVVLLFLCARSLGSGLKAGVATIAFAFGTQTWMIGSQGLWQHGSVNLTLLGMTYALQRAGRNTSERRHSGWVFMAGLLAGMLPGIRPTALVFSVAGGIFVLTAWRGNRWPFIAGGALGLAPGLAWNLYFFHSLLGGYGGGTGGYDFFLPHAFAALSGLLFSPGRGLVVFTPIVLFSLLGAVRAARDPSADGRLLTLLTGAAIVLTLSYALIPFWNGGHCYGPRYLTDAMAVAALLLVYVVPRDLRDLRSPLRRRRFAGAGPAFFVVALTYSIAVQAVGAYSGAAGPIWNAIPIDIARDPGRIWQLRDGPIERNARAAYYHYAPDYPTQAPGYAAGFAGHVLAIQDMSGTSSSTTISSTTIPPAIAIPPAGATSAAGIASTAGKANAVDPTITAHPGVQIDVSTVVRNDGRSRWYGYTTGVYNGEARIRVRIYDQRGIAVSESPLYVEGAPAAGETARALGTIGLPVSRGAYTAVFEPIALGIPSIGQHGDPSAFRMPLVIK